MKYRYLPRFPSRGTKNILYLIAATAATSGFAIVTYQAIENPNLIPFHGDLPEKFRAGINGVARSSRAVYTITSNVVDYKYSLHGVSPDSEDYSQKLSEVHIRSAGRMLKLCDANKGFYVKAGQFVAALRNVPKEYSSTLSSLQDKAAPCHFESIKKVLMHNLGEKLSDMFLSVDEQPLAAASIAQVHRALLKDHQEVAIKVQYPGLEHQMKIDIAAMIVLSKLVAWVFPEYRFDWMVSEFEKSISAELDFVLEAKNSERTCRNFMGNDMVRVPRVYWDLTSSQVLTMEFCSGFKVDDMILLKEFGINPKKVARVLAEVFAEMIFVHGFVHGDLHPGNILVSPEGPNGFRLVLLDHGICKELDEQFRLDYCKLWYALIRSDSEKIEHLADKFGVGKYSRYFPIIFIGRTIDSKSALGRGMTDEEKNNLKQKLKSLKMEDVSSFMESLPPDFLTILRTDGLLRSIVSKLGASQRIRLLAYAKCSVYGLSTKLDPGSSQIRHTTLGYKLSRFKTAMTYLRLKLSLDFVELLSQMQEVGHVLMHKVRQMLAQACCLFLTREPIS